MINKIYGQIVEKKELSIVIKTSFLEFEILVTSFYIDSSKLNEEIFILTYLYVKEDELRLFGFINLQERKLFEELITVEGIGPKVALRVLSRVRYDNFSNLIEREDINSLAKVKGIGKKTAGKILLKLQGKFLKINEIVPLNFFYEDIIESIANMGFDKKLVKVKLDKVLMLEELISLKQEEKEKFIFREVLKEITS